MASRETGQDQMRHAGQGRGFAWLRAGRITMVAVAALGIAAICAEAGAAGHGSSEARPLAPDKAEGNRMVVAQRKLSSEECFIANFAGNGPPECQKMMNAPAPAPMPKDATPAQELDWLRRRYAEQTCDRDKTELCLSFTAHIAELEAQIERDRQIAETKRQEELAALAAREKQIQDEAARLLREKAAVAAAEARRIQEEETRGRQRLLIYTALGMVTAIAGVAIALTRFRRRSAYVAPGAAPLPVAEMAKALYWLTRTGIVLFVAVALWSTSGEILRIAFALLPGWARQPLVEALDAAKAQIEHRE